MGDGFQFIDIIIFAMVAAFLVLRLRSVLGRRTGHEKPPRTDRLGRPAEQAGESNDTVIQLPERAARETAGAHEGDDLTGGLTQIKIADPAFDAEQFVGGARAALEMIVTSYAAGDKDTLRPLLSDEVFENFSQAIDVREQRNETLETTLVAIRTGDIVEATMDGRIAFVTIKFVSEQINVTRDAEGEPVDSDPTAVTDLTDIWTFARNTRSRNPNWTLVATEASN